MHIRASRTAGLLVGLVLAAVGLGTVTGCGSEQVAGSRQDAVADAKARAQRARKVAAAWDGSAAAAAWRAGYHPLGDVIQLPRGGLRSEGERRALQGRMLVLRGALPGTGPEDGRVTWAGGDSLTRPLVGAKESYESMAGPPARGKPHLTVTGAKPGEMTVATSRGPATVPAWLFTLDGYDSPLKRAAVVPSKLPEPPIRRARGVPGLPLHGLFRTTPDGRSVTVDALHGACDDGAVVSVLETRGSVVLWSAVRKREDVGLCTDQAISQQVTVKLDRPVGDRVLLDSITGRPVPYRPLRGPTANWS
ncbi:hypothetical protein [Streptomyces meridianus]|uniref:Lipoprotein n=1 Tax=Streptomyces meridianus TaxID=2938945 RepID=A0ABT0X162_9ACTN|nr:hypothetical protein [Streptomyces meridianus]MCM2576297.1 hypothetical protein [Streptomyces meridianus]